MLSFWRIPGAFPTGSGILLTYALLAPAASLFAAERTVLDLQPFRTESTISFSTPDGSSGRATLVQLQPAIDSWLLLRLQQADGSTQVWHLENPFPDTQDIILDPAHPRGVVIVTGEERSPCGLWETTPSALETASRAKSPYVTLCDGRLLLRNPTIGSRSRKEWASDFVRDRTRYGEQITGFFKDKVFRDRYFSGARRKEGSISQAARSDSGGPPPLLLSKSAENLRLDPHDLGLPVLNSEGKDFSPGKWYAISNQPGIFFALVTPDLVAEGIVAAEKERLKPLDKVESMALAYLVAFDLSQFDLGFSLGTEHPRVGWSDRVAEPIRDPALPGPDGFDTIDPLVRTGMVQPFLVPRLAATITGGFKRLHGAFKYGELAQRNRGSHYGFLESGVLLSTLQPGLATLLVYADGRVDLKTWTEADRADLGSLRYARQNGVAIVEPDGHGGHQAGTLVRQWGPGNWSGSESKQERTLRAGVALVETGTRRFLVYGYFSSATPNAMALVFLSSGAEYAFHLDMNAPEHTYMALYHSEGSRFVVKRLVTAMAELDLVSSEAQEVPRYVGYPDTRDFFYVLRKKGRESP